MTLLMVSVKKVVSLKKTSNELLLEVHHQYSVQKYIAESLLFRKITKNLQKDNKIFF